MDPQKSIWDMIADIAIATSALKPIIIREPLIKRDYNNCHGSTLYPDPIPIKHTKHEQPVKFTNN
jgi:hypothetical protein